MNENNQPLSKQCAYCGLYKPLSEFRRRTGKRAKGQSRRGACRDCRKTRAAAAVPAPAPAKKAGPGRPAVQPALPAVAAQPAQVHGTKPAGPKIHSLPERSKEGKAAEPKGKPRTRAMQQGRGPQPRGMKPDPTDISALVPSAKGMILMRGHSDKGRRWHQEIDLELAVTLVREHAAVIVNRRTIRRLYSNKDFRKYILTRDHYTCHFCGAYGDTIDHLLPRAKGGHTTPVNCVCACNECNQSKADRLVEEFMRR
ncbi:HNH endonuclease [Paenibacillus tengchongensis]|uniref:HNH endonuclease n=1 Tax=Paenibacillus tengchongensis TaxID=2608684 RepID=UPI0016520435|nr:HNH endonuclease [Paenibacillus tengchongensis]